MDLITESAALAEFCQRQRGVDFIAVDTEFMRERTFWPILCLVQIGTVLLRCPEAKTNAAWADALADLEPEATMPTRAFSGHLGRGIATDYVRAAVAPETPAPAPYPVQRGLTTAMRDAAGRAGDVQRMQAWAGQAAALARPEPAADLVRRLWDEAQALLP